MPLQPCSVEVDEVLLTVRPRLGGAAAAATASPGGAGGGKAPQGGAAAGDAAAPDAFNDFAAGVFLLVAPKAVRWASHGVQSPRPTTACATLMAVEILQSLSPATRLENFKLRMLPSLTQMDLFCSAKQAQTS